MKIDSKKVSNSSNKQLNSDYDDFKDLKLLSSKTKKSSKKILTRTLLGIIAISGLSFIFMVGNTRSTSNDSAKISPVTTQNTVKQDNTTPTLSQPGESDLDKQLQESKQKADEAQQQAIQAQAAADKSAQDAQKIQAEQDAKYQAAMQQYQQQQSSIQAQQQQQQNQLLQSNSNNPPAVTNPCPDPTYINNMYMQLARLQAQLADAPNIAKSYGGGYGMTARGYQTALDNLRAQLNSQINATQSQIDSYKRINPGC